MCNCYTEEILGGNCDAAHKDPTVTCSTASTPGACGGLNNCGWNYRDDFCQPVNEGQGCRDQFATAFRSVIREHTTSAGNPNFWSGNTNLVPFVDACSLRYKMF